MAGQAHTIDATIKRVSIKEGKQPGVLVEINGADTWLTQSLPQYYVGRDVTKEIEGRAVKLTYKDTWLSSIDEVYEPFEATPADMGVPDAPSAPMRRDATGRSIERQVALKCATELMVAVLARPETKPPANPVETAQVVAAMAASLWAAIEGE